MRRALSLFLLFGALAALLLVILGTSRTGLPPLGALLDPAYGVYRTARTAEAAPPETIHIPGLQGEVRVHWDERRVPHIFAQHDLDGVAALGYVTARERLFQMDFIPRAASGRLAEALGPAALPADRFLRATGMEWGARRNLERIRREAGEELAVLEAYCRGMDAYVATLRPRDLPFEFRLLGYEPDPCTPLLPLRVLQYMNFDLSYRTDEAGYGILRERLGDEAYGLLYPAEPEYALPIVPPTLQGEPTAGRRRAGDGSRISAVERDRMRSPERWADAASDSRQAHLHEAFTELSRGGSKEERLSPLLEGYLPGKGSNNWAVDADHSTTGAPLLAGDMHLSLTLPAIWFEVHLVTPSMNSYGVTVPGAPLPVEGFTDRHAWAFTNTGSDQIDHYRLDVDPSTQTYSFDGGRRTLELEIDTIVVRGRGPVIDTLYYSHWGPVTRLAGEWVAQQWTAHKPSTTLAALLDMNRARSHAAFQEALRAWDTPMQNILYGDVEGTISIRSTGMMPVRAGGTGAGLLDGSSTEGSWTGRVPFDELPYAEKPERGYLTSTNQKPTDAAYPHYLGHEWSDEYRSIRIDTLLRRQRRHGVADFQRYQADVHAVQRDFFVPLLDTLGGLSDRARSLREMLSSWDGETTVDRREPIALHFFLEELEELTWDEEVFQPVRLHPEGDSLDAVVELPRPAQTRIHYLLTQQPASIWLDIEGTPERESAGELLRAALEQAATRLEIRYGEASDAWTWGRRHRVRLNHLIGALEPLGRGPAPYPGFDATLSPAADTLATHSASWRMIVDFSGDRPKGSGVYPGGQSGNPFSRFYDVHLDTYLGFQYYDLHSPADEAGLPEDLRLYSSTFLPQAD